MITPRTRTAKNNGRIFALTGLLIIAALTAWISVTRALSPVAPGSVKTVLIVIPKGASTMRIGEMLTRRGLIHNARAFFVMVWLTRAAGKLKAGTYELSPGDDASKIAELLARGETATNAVTIPPGITAQQVAQRVAALKLADKDEFLTIVRTEGETFHFDDGFAPPANLEGYLFPLTYRVPKGTPPRVIVRMMLDGFDQNVVRPYPSRRDWRSVVILASLIQAETQSSQDSPLIASVYVNRLRRGMPLQCDATVEYALPKHKARLFFSDLKVASPYNTYLHRGLPPTPICSPDLNSIQAALDPARTDYLFYVAGPDGRSVFSRTLAEQDQAIARVRG